MTGVVLAPPSQLHAALLSVERPLPFLRSTLQGAAEDGETDEGKEEGTPIDRGSALSTALQHIEVAFGTAVGDFAASLHLLRARLLLGLGQRKACEAAAAAAEDLTCDAALLFQAAFLRGSVLEDAFWEGYSSSCGQAKLREKAAAAAAQYSAALEMKGEGRQAPGAWLSVQCQCHWALERMKQLHRQLDAGDAETTEEGEPPVSPSCSGAISVIECPRDTAALTHWPAFCITATVQSGAEGPMQHCFPVFNGRQLQEQWTSIMVANVLVNKSSDARELWLAGRKGQEEEETKAHDTKEFARNWWAARLQLDRDVQDCTTRLEAALGSGILALQPECTLPSQAVTVAASAIAQVLCGFAQLPWQEGNTSEPRKKQRSRDPRNLCKPAEEVAAALRLLHAYFQLGHSLSAPPAAVCSLFVSFAAVAPAGAAAKALALEWAAATRRTLTLEQQGAVQEYVEANALSIDFTAMWSFLLHVETVVAALITAAGPTEDPMRWEVDEAAAQLQLQHWDSSKQGTQGLQEEVAARQEAVMAALEASPPSNEAAIAALCQLLSVMPALYREPRKRKKEGKCAGGAPPTLLYLSPALQGLPWETLPCIRGRPAVRLFRAPPVKAPALTFPLNSLSYLINPSKDLKDTEQRMQGTMAALKSRYPSLAMDGIAGRSPNEEESTHLLHRSQGCFVYSGHGAGWKHLKSALRSSQATGIVDIALLFGCSSVAMRPPSVWEQTSPLLQFLNLGTQVVVGNLWDVTDKDLDSFAEKYLNALLSGSDAASATAEARLACKVEFLVGASPVIYV